MHVQRYEINVCTELYLTGADKTVFDGFSVTKGSGCILCYLTRLFSAYSVDTWSPD